MGMMLMLKVVGRWKLRFLAGPAFVVGCLLLLPTNSFSQETRNVDGRKFTVHRVEAGQTLFAIARSYAVPVDVLLAANPGAQDGLSIGEEILVPQDAVVKKEVKSAPTLLRDGELQHIVAKKETLFGIAKNYGLDVNELLQRNPELNAGLREGMAVVIPKKAAGEVTEVIDRPAVAEELVDHVVQPGETLFGLGQRYGVAPERIAALNAGLTEGLKAGAIIRIPKVAGHVLPPSEEVAPVRQGQRYKVGLLLPFAIDRNDSILAANSGHDVRFHEAARIAAQYSAGARMAIDSLEKLGLDAEITVLDVGEDPRVWNGVLKQPELKDIDLFIGPFHRTAIDQLARAIPSAHIVCPVPQSNKVILGNPSVSKVTPTRVDLIRHTARYVAQRHARENIILVRPDIHADKDAQDQMERGLNEALAGQNGRLRDSVLVLRTGRRDVGDLASKLKSDRLNVLVVPSEDVEFVTALVSKLKPLASKQRIVLVGLESWLGMETLAASDLDVLGFMHAAATFADYTDLPTQAFVKTFRERYKQDVDEYALLGFDVTFYYLKALMEHGRNFPEHFADVHTTPLHMVFRMARTGPENGYRNESAIMLQQQDLRLVKAP
jgi:LysM repeat protein